MRFTSRLLLLEAKSFGIKQKSKATETLDEMYSAVSNWEEVFKEFEVPPKDLEIIGRDIESRLATIKPD